MRILVLMHTNLIPPDKIEKNIDWDSVLWETEYNVLSNLKENGHEVLELGVISDLTKIRKAVDEFKPDIIFNLLEEFDGEAIFDQNVVSYLELLKIPYTGCNPRGLMLARDKALAKKIMLYHNINTPKFFVSSKRGQTSRKPRNMRYPLIVKCLNEEASMGLAKASIVKDKEKLQERIAYINKEFGDDAIIEEFVSGREFFVGVYGNQNLKVLPVWELRFENVENSNKEFYSNRAKFDPRYRKRKGIRTCKAEIAENLEKRIQKIAKRSYRALNLNGYARIDLRINEENEIFVIEANPNPDISKRDEFAQSANHLNIKYGDILEKILRLGLSWRES